MTVQRQSVSVRKYDGFSYEAKPASTSSDTIPHGSTFTESDTKQVWIYQHHAPAGTTGAAVGGWVLATGRDNPDVRDDRMIELLQSIDTTLRELLKRSKVGRL